MYTQKRSEPEWLPEHGVPETLQPFLHSSPCSLPSLEGLYSWPALRQPSGTATLHIHSNIKHRCLWNNLEILGFHGNISSQPLGERGFPVQPPHSQPNASNLALVHKIRWQSWGFIKRQMLKRDIVRLLETTARAAARRQLSIRDTNELVRINSSPSYCHSSAYAHM